MVSEWTLRASEYSWDDPAENLGVVPTSELPAKTFEAGPNPLLVRGERHRIDCSPLWCRAMRPPRLTQHQRYATARFSPKAPTTKFSGPTVPDWVPAARRIEIEIPRLSSPRADSPLR